MHFILEDKKRNKKGKNFHRRIYETESFEEFLNYIKESGIRGKKNGF